MEKKDYTAEGRAEAQVADIQAEWTLYQSKHEGGIVEAARVNKTGYVKTVEGEQFGIIGDMVVKMEDGEGNMTGITLYPQATFNLHFIKGKSLFMEHTVEKIEALPIRTEPKTAPVVVEEVKFQPKPKTSLTGTDVTPVEDTSTNNFTPVEDSSTSGVEEVKYEPPITESEEEAQKTEEPPPSPVEKMPTTKKKKSTPKVKKK